MRFFYLLFLPLFFIGCSKESPSKNNLEACTDVELVGEIRMKVAKKMKENYGLIACGTGSQMMDKIKMIALSFNYYKPVDIEKARELLLAATNEMVLAVNEDVRIHPFLHDFPFGPKNVEIRIYASKEDRSDLPATDLSIFTEQNGMLTYKAFTPSQGRPLTTLYEETYGQAMLKQSQALNLK